MNRTLLPNTTNGKLVHVIEECSEVTKAICKIHRFGLYSKHPNKTSNNIEDLKYELKDLKKVIIILERELKKF